MTKRKPKKPTPEAVSTIERMAIALFDAGEATEQDPRRWNSGAVCDDEREAHRHMARIAYAAHQGDKPEAEPKRLVLGAAVYAVLEKPVRYELTLADGTTHRLPAIQSLALRFADSVLKVANGKEEA